MTKSLREAAQQALEALAGYRREVALLTGGLDKQPCDAEIALRAALEQAEKAETERDALRAELREATAATNDPAVNNLRTLPESIRMLRAQRDELLEALESVLCDPEGKCCIDGSDADRAVVDKALAALRAALGQECYVVTGNEFHGAPPEPYANWGDAIAAMLDRGVIRGLRISALEQQQDPELSAALGWPGGISDPTLDRETLLQQVARLVERAHGIGEEAT